jgi:hypothetical protein
LEIVSLVLLLDLQRDTLLRHYESRLWCHIHHNFGVTSNGCGVMNHDYGVKSKASRWCCCPTSKVMRSKCVEGDGDGDSVGDGARAAA